MLRPFGSFAEASQFASSLATSGVNGVILRRQGAHWEVEADITDDPALTGITQLTSDDAKTICELREKLSQLQSRTDHLYQENRASQERVDQLRQENGKLAEELSVLQAEISLIKPLIELSDDNSRFSADVLSKMSPDQSRLLHRFAYLMSLAEAGRIEQGAFDQFSKSVNLWVALHNYEKIRSGPTKPHWPSTPRPTPAIICPSCGQAIVDGHCRCSD